MKDAGASAQNLARQSGNLAQHLALINGQPGLTGMGSATDVFKHLTYVAEQLGLHTMLLCEFVRRECEENRVMVHPGLPPEEADGVDVTQSKGLIFLGGRSVAAAQDTSARALNGMHGLIQQLATRDDTPERIGVDPALRSKGFTMNLLHAAVLGDWDLVEELAGRMDVDQARDLFDHLEATAKAVGRVHGLSVE